MIKYNYKCFNCKSEIPLPDKLLNKGKKSSQVMPKTCFNCNAKIQAPRQSMRPGKAVKK